MQNDQNIKSIEKKFWVDVDRRGEKHQDSLPVCAFDVRIRYGVGKLT